MNNSENTPPSSQGLEDKPKRKRNPPLPEPMGKEEDGPERWIVSNVDSRTEVSSWGRTRSAKTKKIRSRFKHGAYIGVTIRCPIKQKRKIAYLHWIVAQAFIPNPQGLPQAHHRNHDKMDSRASNLEWVTRKQNMAYAKAAGRLRWDKALRGKDSPQAKAVGQYTPEWKVIRTFDTLAEASAHIHAHYSAITRAIETKTKHGKQRVVGNCFWRFI